MPRTSRIKRELGIYHIMARSISEITLFRNYNDKNVFLKYLKRYKDIFSFKVYAYCIMNNHFHLLIDANGADISKFMHNINQCYAQYYNRKYCRNGHVFGDRFKSKIAYNDLSVMCMSAYIHNNPKDIKGFKNRVEDYNYSSLGIYLGNYKDNLGIIDRDFVLQYFHNDPIIAPVRYFQFVKSRTNINADDISADEFEFLNIPYEYKPYKKPIIRNIDPQQILEYVSNYYEFEKSDVYIKYKHKPSEFRAISVFLMRNLCNLHYSEICGMLGNITLSAVSRLCYKGYSSVCSNPKYNNIIDKFLQTYKITS